MNDQLGGKGGGSLPLDSAEWNDEILARRRLRQALVSVYTHDARSKFASVQLFFDVVEDGLEPEDRAMARQVRTALRALDRETELLRWAFDSVADRAEESARSDLRTLVDAAVLLARSECPACRIEWTAPPISAGSLEFEVCGPALEILSALDLATGTLARSPAVEETNVVLRHAADGRARVEFQTRAKAAAAPAGGAPLPALDREARRRLEAAARNVMEYDGTLEIVDPTAPADGETIVLELPLVRRAAGQGP